MVLQEQTANMQNFDVLSGLYKNYYSLSFKFLFRMFYVQIACMKVTVDNISKKYVKISKQVPFTIPFKMLKKKK